MLASTSCLLFRCLEPGDEPFRRELFMSSRERELFALPDAIRNTLAAQQYATYLAGLKSTYPNAQHLLFRRTGDPEPKRHAGIVSIADLGCHMQVIDLAVHPMFRSRGTGRLVLEAVMDHCRRTGQIMRGSVTPYNPARRLYARLGISELDVDHGHIRLEWCPKHTSSHMAAPPPFAGNTATDAGKVQTDAFQPPPKNG